MSSYNNFKSTTIRGAFNNLNYPDNSIKASSYFQNDVSISGQLYVNNINCVNLNSYNISSLINSLSGPIYNNFINQYLINNSLSGLISNNFRNQNLINNSLSGLIFNNFTNQYLINNSLTSSINNNLIYTNNYFNTISSYIISNNNINSYQNLYLYSLSSLVYTNYINQNNINQNIIYNGLSGSIYTYFVNQNLINNSLSGLIYNNFTNQNVINTSNTNNINSIKTITNNLTFESSSLYINLNSGINLGLNANIYFSPSTYIIQGTSITGYTSTPSTNLVKLPYLDVTSSIKTDIDNIKTILTGATYDTPYNYLNFANNIHIYGNLNIGSGITLQSPGIYNYISNTTLTYVDPTSSIQGQFNNITSTYATQTTLNKYLTISSALLTYATQTALNNYSQLSNINTFTNNQLIYKNIYLNDAGFNNMNYMQLSLVASGSASATNPSVCGIDFTTFNGKGNSSARIYGLDNNAYSAHLVFSTAPPNGFYNSQERMRIQDNGNIAIGKTTASYLLDVNGSINGTTIYENGTSISSKYLTIANASSTYATITSLSNYLTTSSASSTYLSIANASSTYATITSLSNYLTTSSASSTYATITSLSNYLTTSTASSTYATITSLSNYLLSSTASSTYATITSLSNFLLATSPAVSSYSIAITEDITPTSAYIPFTLSSTSVSNAILKISSYLNYNPSTNTLNCNHRGSVTVQSGANLQLQPGATSNICPIGTILMMAVQSSFSGWLSCNGATCSTTTYAGLFNVIGYAYGGSGATFNVPDFQGAFLRGFGSPNTSRNLSYASDAFGTYQASQIGSHTHSLNLSNNGVSSGVASAYVGTGINAQTTTTTETRPYNYAVQYYIKY